MSRNDGVLSERHETLLHHEVTVAYTAGMNADQHFAGLGLQHGTIFEDDGGLGFLNDGYFHKFS